MKIFKIFVACPTDVEAERQVIRGVVEELNKTVCPLADVQLEVLGWDRDVHPDQGDDPQQVINTQIKDDYDILIGIMWTRFGTPTGHAGSGTEEEFNRAASRSDGRRVNIMFYFKDQGLDLSKIDIPQLEKVRDFQKRVSAKCLFARFFSTAEFEQSVRIHLAQVIRERKDDPKASVAVEPAPTQALVEEGFIDLMSTGTEKFNSATSTLNSVAVVTRELGERIDQRNSELEGLRKARGAIRPVDVQRISLLTAENFRDFSLKMDAATPVFGEEMRVGLTAMSKAAAISREMGSSKRPEFVKFKENIGVLRDTTDDSIGKTKNFKAAIMKIPPITTALAKARTNAVSSIDRWLMEMEAASRLIDQLYKSM